jgi:WASH complex subunit 7
MLVPAMCLSWVEASLQAKESMYKATRNVSRSALLCLLLLSPHPLSLREMYFTDDGFAMGLSYCLAILKQTNKALSLHWFDTVTGKYKKDLSAHQEQQAARALKEKKKAERESSKRKSSFMGGVFSSSKKAAVEDDEEDQHQDFEEVHSLQLTAKRLEAMRRENDQLFYSMSGAAIFFKRTDVDI